MVTTIVLEASCAVCATPTVLPMVLLRLRTPGASGPAPSLAHLREDVVLGHGPAPGELRQGLPRSHVAPQLGNVQTLGQGGRGMGGMECAGPRWSSAHAGAATAAAACVS